MATGGEGLWAKRGTLEALTAALRGSARQKGAVRFILQQCMRPLGPAYQVRAADGKGAALHPQLTPRPSFACSRPPLWSPPPPPPPSRPPPAPPRPARHPCGPPSETSPIPPSPPRHASPQPAAAYATLSRHMVTWLQDNYNQLKSAPSDSQDPDDSQDHERFFRSLVPGAAAEDVEHFSACFTRYQEVMVGGRVGVL